MFFIVKSVILSWTEVFLLSLFFNRFPLLKEENNFNSYPIRGILSPQESNPVPSKHIFYAFVHHTTLLEPIHVKRNYKIISNKCTLFYIMFLGVLPQCASCGK
uniref:Uncharacterized protein n=1 Tax=Cacopsylla melanoneura TaxID=428564 RepID=A0A8D9E6F7_9HEMI